MIVPCFHCDASMCLTFLPMGVNTSEQTDLHFTCMLRLHATHSIDASKIVHIAEVKFCLQGITCSVLSSWKFKPHLTPLQSTMNPAARPDAVVSEQQVHVEVTIGNRRLVETKNLHIPRYVAVQQCIAKPAIICLQWRYPLLFNPLFLAILFVMTTQCLKFRNRLGCVSCCRDVQAYMQEKEDAGATVVLLSVSSCLVAAFAILDCVRPEACGVVSALQRMGVTVYMVTGEAQKCITLSNCSTAYQPAAITKTGQRLRLLAANCLITQITVMQETIDAPRMLLPLQLASSMSWQRYCRQGKQNR